jgi:AmmeMemoRadiSam system protein B
MTRLPAVAGQFYSASADGLRDEVARALPTRSTPTAAVAAIAPHAGLMYSGRVAGSVYADLVLPPTVILLGPNHTGHGPIVSLYPDGQWAIPGANVSIDSALTDDLARRFPAAQTDTTAHQFEHCLELQLPFLVYGPRHTATAHRVSMVAVVLGTTEPSLCRRFGAALADMIKDRTAGHEPAPLLIASTDMNHYESDDRTRHKDSLAIAAMHDLDPDALYRCARTHRISMCGLGAVMTVLAAARAVGAGRASLRSYATSADVTEDRERVVGYAGLLIA